MSEDTYLDTSRSCEARARDLVYRMNLEEAASQLLHSAPAIPRLGVPAYNWWNEALHGVARAGTATVFPQAIALAASFDPAFVGTVAEAISTEGRAKYHEAVRRGDRGIYKGLTFWSPNINIFRDPRWGRGHETYGEDPWLTSRLGVAFVRGLQGSDPRYLKSAACAKHYAVHSGPENLRHSFDARVSAKDLRETYLPAFRALVMEAKVESVMGAYNRTNGEPCCGSETLLVKILRGEWGFKGHVVSDCWAIRDFHEHHKITKSPEESAALALKNGCDVNCGCVYAKLMDAHKQGLITEAQIRQAAIRLMTTRMKLGMFDPAEEVPFATIPFEKVDCEDHRALSLTAARKGLVLLKNDGVLPLDTKKLKTIAVIGPNALSINALKGNYCGTPSSMVTVLGGIRALAGSGVRVLYAEGSHLYKDRVEGLGEAHDRFAEAVSVALRADVVVLCLGLDPSIEGEEGDASNEYAAGDKRDLDLPLVQRELMEAVKAAVPNKPIILVSLTGSAMAYTWADENVSAIVQAWYPGAMGGAAVAELLFGEYSPSGRLPVTFYRSTADLPDFTDYAMRNRTYRYFEGEPLYPFGFGLSFTRFEYSDATLSASSIVAGEALSCGALVKNVGGRSGDEVAQLYLSVPGAGAGMPIRELRGVRTVSLKAGEETRVSFDLSARDLSSINNEGRRVVVPGTYRVSIGGHQGDPRSTALSGTSVSVAEFEVTGAELGLEY